MLELYGQRLEFSAEVKPLPVVDLTAATAA